VTSVLILEDEENIRLSMARRLERVAGEVAQSGTLAEARDELSRRAFDLLVTDVNLPDGDGVDLVKELHAADGGTDAIIVTAYGTVEHAVDAMRHGAIDYLQKPVRLDELALVVERALERRGERARLAAYERAEKAQAMQQRLVGEDPAWLQAVGAARKFAEAHADPHGSSAEGLPTALITGETGSGKGVIARLIHDHAVRVSEAASAPFVQVNGAAIPSERIEVELFGREKGGGEEAQAGFFELARGGTVLLDEIAEMSPELQSKLLVVMEGGAFRRVGGTRERRAACRVVCATNADLDSRVAKGEFREDLYYRVSSFVIKLPPLRERPGDARRLAEEALSRLARERGAGRVRFTEDALERIDAHSWPGNVRELIHAVQRALILRSGEEIRAADLGIEERAASIPAGGQGEPGAIVIDFEHGPHTFEELERALIEQALSKARGNVTKAARLVGMPRGSFRYRMEKAGLSTPS
jgi:DNA-binding NtrC family response regulator